MGVPIDCTGAKFGRVTAIKPVGKNKRNNVIWLCQCDCGNQFVTQYHLLKCGHTKSCGCWKREVNSVLHRTHGQTTTRLHGIWSGMKARCNNSHVKDFPYYGGRGIKVCNEWSKSFEAFRDWANANGYSDTLTLDRIDANKDYCPENCRWVDRLAQSRNQRSNVVLTLYGITKTQIEWSEICGLDRHTIRERLKRGWSVEKTLTTVPTNTRKEKREETSRKIELLKQQAI